MNRFAQDEKAAHKVFTIETREMKLANAARFESEKAEIEKCRLDLETYQFAETQEAPAAAHLERLVNDDIEVLSKEVHALR